MDFVKPSIYHRTIDGTMLTMAREAAGLTQGQLAARVATHLEISSLSRQFIAQIERPGDNEVRTEIAVALENVINFANTKLKLQKKLDSLIERIYSFEAAKKIPDIYIGDVFVDELRVFGCIEQITPGEVRELNLMGYRVTLLRGHSHCYVF